MAIGYCPTPTTSPTDATTQRVAALVIPLTWPPFAIIAPAPKNPIPVTIASAILEVLGSRPSPIVVNIADPRQTSIWVRRPAGLFFSSRSNPITAPNPIATSKRMTISKFRSCKIVSKAMYSILFLDYYFLLQKSICSLFLVLPRHLLDQTLHRIHQLR